MRVAAPANALSAERLAELLEELKRISSYFLAKRLNGISSFSEAAPSKHRSKTEPCASHRATSWWLLDAFLQRWLGCAPRPTPH